MWYLIGLVWIALIFGIITVYNRRQRQHNAEREKKLAALLENLKPAPAAGVDASRPAAAPTAAPPARAASVEFRKKQRLLPQPTALLYYVFRTGLPDHEIFTGLTLADVLEPAPAVAGPARSGKLLTQRLDLVVCTKQLEVVAGVIIGEVEGGAAVVQCLQTAGIRMVRVNPAAAPRHHQVRELIYGKSA